jgi:hypothetical protein
MPKGLNVVITRVHHTAYQRAYGIDGVLDTLEQDHALLSLARRMTSISSGDYEDRLLLDRDVFRYLMTELELDKRAQKLAYILFHGTIRNYLGYCIRRFTDMFALRMKDLRPLFNHHPTSSGLSSHPHLIGSKMFPSVVNLDMVLVVLAIDETHAFETAVLENGIRWRCGYRYLDKPENTWSVVSRYSLVSMCTMRKRHLQGRPLTFAYFQKKWKKYRYRCVDCPSITLDTREYPFCYKYHENKK